MTYDYRRMKKALPDNPGLWAYRVRGASGSVNVAVTWGTGGMLFMHHPNGGVSSVAQWARSFPTTRWHRIS